MSGGPAAPQQERSRRSAQQILAAAVDVLTADGIADFTMSSVSELAGLSVGGVYGRFPNKQSLLREVKNEVLTELEEAIAERLAAVGESGGGPAEVLEAFVTGLSEHLYARTRLFAFVFLQSADDAVMRRRGFDFHQRMKDALRDALAPYPIEPAGPGEADRIDVVYEVVVQSITIRAVSAGTIADGERTYRSVPGWRQYAAELTEIALLYLTSPPRRSS
ncbi:AcrR family transcriptional regulator [Thermocatellispora tengchongensis]|uniref:AcrR family transcriptional regulator n=1 Tax=Thermocatellispora tengchongensis TaxID=1073253 RepID=A0A840PJ05_9ACTN|nr:TetR/AcrR family transcriptional regulator [Thermocatellispora tengchongensis]MBB5137893.1 AcrR family transcriptional regulator [Thermocatellispora tengchongensis]